ncbi:alpha/beta hydrolase [Nonomuraea sp. WAC 01424]|uniref:alpha/beta fold hydrolase n=1 Tax=Nonomuraea sp. WAC 01424 TaxID=2203200 RepID=UPI000F7888F8|nr:alpha/beta hydrolase [Nonomuraea sp. WAC 01424]RSN15468.1 alpha/beta hydrolase [Nonomuraea sp. WAC 01424]
MILNRMAPVLPPLAWGAVAGVSTPRGPLTPAAALTSIGLSLVVGGVAGYLARSRWAMIAAPAVFAVVFEIVRTGAEGPSVDAPQGGLFGVLALLAGRGVHGLLALLPMLVGAACGAGLARSGSGAGRVRHWLGRTLIGVLAMIVAALAIGVALPASTAPITGERAVAELTAIPSGSHRLGLMIRGRDTAKPVLLFLPGAPGAAERGAVRKHLSALEDHVVVATLDRRGGGSSYPTLEPTATLTPASETGDILAAANYLKTRFGKDRIYLLAHSGGTLPAVLAVQQRPELFHAYVGVGQAVNTGAADRVQYADTLAWARGHRDRDLTAALEAVGPPPYAGMYGYEPMLLAESKVYATGNGQGGLDESLAAPEYTLLDKVHLVTGFLDAYDRYYPKARDLDLRTLVPRLAVPAYFIDGADEVPARSRLLDDWYATLVAPHKEHTVLPGAGHRSLYEQPDRFTDILVGRVLATGVRT